MAILNLTTGIVFLKSWSGSMSGSSLTLTGTLSLADGSAAAPSLTWAGSTVDGFWLNSADANRINVTLNGTTRFQFGNSGLRFRSAQWLSWSAGEVVGTGDDLFLSRESAAVLQMGTDAAGVTNQMFKGPDRITSDGVGGNLTFAGGRNRGASAGGSLIFQTSPVAGAGVTGTLADRLTIDSTGLSTFALPGLATTETPAVKLSNATASTAGVPVQISPSFDLFGSAYNSTSTLSESHRWFSYVLPATVAGTTTSTLKFGHSLNGAAATFPATLTSSGSLTLLSEAYVNGAIVMGGSAGAERGKWSASAVGKFTLAVAPVQGTNGVGFDVNTDAVLKVRTIAQTGYATVDALGYSVSGTAGASYGPGAVTSITVVNGIVTACS